MLALVNLFRLLIPLLLMVLYWTLEPRLVGQANSRLFFVTGIAYFLFAALSIPTLQAALARSRWCRPRSTSVWTCWRFRC